MEFDTQAFSLCCSNCLENWNEFCRLLHEQELEFRIFTNCRNIQYKVHRPF